MRAPTIQFTKQLYIEDVGPQRVESIRFSTFSDTEILKAAEIEVIHGVYYNPNKMPIDNGLLDPHMGPANNNYLCKTCHGKILKCPGHYGYLALALPVYNVGYFSTVVNIMKSICKECSRILLEEKERLEFLRKMRNPKSDPLKKNEVLKQVVKKCNALAGRKKGQKCSRCGYINGRVKKAHLTIQLDRVKVADNYMVPCQYALSHTKDFKGNIDVSSTLDPRRVRHLLKNMLDEDCELLDLDDRPEKLIITNILVPPIALRPSVFVNGGTQSNENDATVKLNRIIQANAILRQEIEGTGLYSKNLTSWHDLQLEVAQYINSDVHGMPLYMKTAKPLGGFVQRITGKQGRFRGNLSAKRVEYTGRTVISPDPNMKINEVAIPLPMAQILTYPERVSHHNIEKLRQSVRNGPNKYPGAHFIKQLDGAQISLMRDSRKRHADELKCGYIVDRHLEDGDIVLFNRQPSLHRMSFMCHRAKIMPWRTLRFNESVCNPYNADFDGDEMNIHVPQTEEARTEALTLMGVENNLCTPKNGEILVASTQDFLTSSYLITRKDTFYDRASFSLMCSYMGDAMDPIDLPTPAIVKPLELWTGKQLFNILLRPHAKMRVYVNLTVAEKNCQKYSETMCPKDRFVCFRNSELISGQLGKATLGNGNKDGLYSVLLTDYDAHAAAACMNRLAKLSARWIGNHGFSIGIDDVQPEDLLNKKKKETIHEQYGKCTEYIDAYKSGKLVPLPGCNKAQTLEANITGVLNNIRESTAEVCMDNLNWRNSPLIMSQCGSKGSPINICQMIACVGQQSVGGRRAPNGFIDRALPHFEREAKDPDAKGFVQNSFYTGLIATEFFFHTMGGREGLIDTAATCPASGQQILTTAEIKNLIEEITKERFLRFNIPEAGCLLDLQPQKGGCSEAFAESLSKFIQDNSGKSTLSPKLNGEQDSREHQGYLETVAADIVGVTRQQLQVFIETCISRYHLKKIDPGTAIGAIGAMSIGEPGTQMTLKTFHFAGVASMNVTLGVPRIIEIINASKRIRTPIISTTLEHADNEISARIVKGRIEKTLLGQQVKVLNPKKLEVFLQADGSTLQFEFHGLLKKLSKVVVKGIHSVERAIIKKTVENGKETFDLVVEGNGLLSVMGIQGVDGCKTKSNHNMEVWKTLGIEAARKSIIDEIHLTMSSHGMTIDTRHMMLLADLMTSKGEVLGINRYGMQKLKESKLMQASFETASGHLFSSSVSGRVDRIEGVSECIVMGIPMQIGTGMFKVGQSVQPIPLSYGKDPIIN